MMKIKIDTQNKEIKIFNNKDNENVSSFLKKFTDDGFIIVHSNCTCKNELDFCDCKDNK